MEAGGLHVVGTERHESRRIDNQVFLSFLFLVGLKGGKPGCNGLWPWTSTYLLPSSIILAAIIATATSTTPTLSNKYLKLELFFIIHKAAWSKWQTRRSRKLTLFLKS